MKTKGQEQPQGSRYADDPRNYEAPVVEAAHTPTLREKAIWRTALTLAHNICVQDSDRFRDEDANDEAHACSKSADRIRGWVEPTDEQLIEMFAEAGVPFTALNQHAQLQSANAELRGALEELRDKTSCTTGQYAIIDAALEGKPL